MWSPDGPAAVSGCAQSALAGFTGVALHARRLSFRHPRTGERLECCAPRPAELQRLIVALGGPADAAPALSGRGS